MMTKLRVLCLHGFTSNGGVHAQQVRSVTKSLSSDFEFLFPDGPHEVDMSGQGEKEPSMRSWMEYVAENSTAGHRAWWFAREADSKDNQPGGFHGLEKSLDFVGNLIKETGPVDAIWGFSQGARFAGMLMSLLSTPKMEDHPMQSRLSESQGTPSAGIFFSGFKARFEQYESIHRHGIDVPTLHVLGLHDQMVTNEKSRTLLSACRNPSILEHQGGHEIPKSEEDRGAIIRFLREKVHSVSNGL